MIRKGFKHSEETKEKMSKSAKRRYLPIISKNKLIQLSLIENKSDKKIGQLYNVKPWIIRHLRKMFQVFPSSTQIALRMSKARIGYKPSLESQIKHSKSISGKKNPNWGKPKSPETKAKLRLSHLGEKNINWKGGHRIDNFGYIKILNHIHPFCDKDGYVLEHRLIIEKQIRRFLNPKEACHHINKIKNDNRLGNLMVFKTNGAHLRFENGYSISQKEIIFDGRLIKP